MTAEQTIGKTTTTKQVLLKPPQTLIEIETTLIAGLKKAFQLS